MITYETTLQNKPNDTEINTVKPSTMSKANSA